MNREDEILKLARETANQQDGGEAFMCGLAVLARKDVHELLAELAALRPQLPGRRKRAEPLEQSFDEIDCACASGVSSQMHRVGIPCRLAASIT